MKDKPDKVYRLCKYTLLTWLYDVAILFSGLFSLSVLICLTWWWYKGGKPVSFEDISDHLYILIMYCVLIAAVCASFSIPLPYQGNVYIEDDLPEPIYRDRVIVKNNKYFERT